MEVLDILGQSALILAVTAFSLAANALTKKMTNRLVLGYAALCTVVAGWAFFFFLEKVFGTGTFYRLHLAFNLLLAPVGIFFLRVLIRVESAFVRWLFRFSIAYSAAVAALVWTHVGQTPLIRNLAFFGPALLALACAYLMLAGRGIRRGWAGQAAGMSGKSWIYVGAVILLLSAVMDHVPLLGKTVPTVGNVLVCLYLFIVSEVVIHQRLLNASALLNRLALLVFISACFGLVYTIFVAWIEHSPGLFLLNSFLASFIILMLLDPAKRLVNWLFARVFARQYFLFEERVREAERGLTGVLDPAGLAQLALQFVESALRCESATFFALRADATKFRRVRGLRDDALASREILASHPLVAFFSWMKKRGELPVALDRYVETERERSTSTSQREIYGSALQGLEALRANIAIPLLDDAGGEVVVLGFLAMRVGQPPEPWGDNWGVLSVVYPFFEHAARVLKNMDVYVRMREKDRLAALGEMAAGLAHEIRNPLGAIKGAAQCLQPRAAPGPESQSEIRQAELLRVIVEETNRLDNVVTRFLDFSRPLKLDLVETDVGQMLGRTIDLFQSELGRGADPAVAAIELISPPGGFPSLPQVLCAPEQIRQVLVNFVRNALHAIRRSPPAGGGRVRIGAHLARGEDAGAGRGGWLAIFVEDNGPGIPREDLDRVFIPFFTTSPDGTGLGLAISARIVELHGGRIDVQSGHDGAEEGKITKFTVYLPLRKEGER